MIQHGVRLVDHEEALEAAKRFNRLGERVDVDRERLAIRMGREHPICTVHEQVAEGMVEVAHAVGVAIMLSDPTQIKELWERVTMGGENFTQGRERFVTEAVKLVGSRLR